MYCDQVYVLSVRFIVALSTVIFYRVLQPIMRPNDASYVVRQRNIEVKKANSQRDIRLSSFKYFSAFAILYSWLMCLSAYFPVHCLTRCLFLWDAFIFVRQFKKHHHWITIACSTLDNRWWYNNETYEWNMHSVTNTVALKIYNAWADLLTFTILKSIINKFLPFYL